MSELPSVSGKRAISAFENNGFAVVRVSGAHRIMKKPGHRFLLSVPLHGKKHLKKGLLRGLIGAAGKTVDQFVEDLK
jgi:predicted RNA binding protein YcfA (HicA-like mRNA interferase family)